MPAFNIIYFYLNMFLLLQACLQKIKLGTEQAQPVFALLYGSLAPELFESRGWLLVGLISVNPIRLYHINVKETFSYIYSAQEFMVNDFRHF